MKGKFDPLTKKFQKRIVSAETIRGNTVITFLDLDVCRFILTKDGLLLDELELK